MTSNETRQLTVAQRIEELTNLLNQWEAYRLSARDPNEVLRSEQEVQRIKRYLAEYEKELAGSGRKVEEDTSNPILSPAIKKVNRQWMMGIAAALLLALIGYFSYHKLTEVQPDYSKYLSYLAQGDSLVNNQKFDEAKIAYQKALSFNPQDSAAVKKIGLLRQADQYIESKKFTDAQQVFKLIVNIPASSGLSVQARRILGNEGGGGSSTQIQIEASWSGQTLVLKISGGTPFSNPDMPYTFDNLNCADCIEWTKEGNDYVAHIDGSKVNGVSLLLRDGAGNTSSEQIPSRGTDGATSASSTPVPTDPAMRDEQFNGLAESGDQNFAAGKFKEAKRDYTAALQLKPGDARIAQKLAECEKKIAEQEIAEAKKVARMLVQAGSFVMGDENGNPEDRPEHTVNLGAFRLGKYEVTVAQFRAFCNFSNRQMPPAPPGGWIDERPIVNVTWEEAQAFCNWVGGRLPTEAEWEFAAREGGSKKIYSGGNQLDRYAIYRDNSSGRPASVGCKQPNGFGLYDMTGNVSEWCADWFGKYSASGSAKGPASGKYKVVRGGAFNSVENSTQDGNQLRCTYRNSKAPGVRENYLGFRVAWDN